MFVFKGDRQSGLERMKSFIPSAGKDYDKLRNYDFGVESRDNISMLSPYIKLRLVSESEVISSVMSQHSMRNAEKFVQEVVWRNYWKGWLEMRPGIWESYKSSLLAASSSSDYEGAISAETGIDCFDSWCSELVSTGYLHNHARMWFASIWIFTLKLPWQLGADFFIKHLLDGDAASNTLSWRWVAGIQTQGKMYFATSANIKKYTDKRFIPAQEFEQESVEIKSDEDRTPQPIDVYPEISSHDDSVLIVHEEDLSLEFFLKAKKIIVIRPEALPLERSELVLKFINDSIDDQLKRLSASNVVCEVTETSELQKVIQDSGRSNVSLVKPTVGYLKDFLRPIYSTHELKVTEMRRPWDTKLYPFAKKGFFPFKKAVIPRVLNEILEEGHLF